MELIVVLIIALLVLGPKRLPSAAKSLGEGVRGFKESLRGAETYEPEVLTAEPTEEDATA
ncbi:MAG TPA: twin-arginine translocase TatA/TatE family subunit [Solirubrobacteraceae bacterium]|nr:twin-arginine translocase TatA/TatE family subunit [Solirubrobacteraceae bacterium]